MTARRELVPPEDFDEADWLEAGDRGGYRGTSPRPARFYAENLLVMRELVPEAVEKAVADLGHRGYFDWQLD
jgi:hypothetical protein